MEKLTIKHLAPYLPYGLKCEWEYLKAVELQTGNIEYVVLNQFKPILRPLSDLTKEFEVAKRGNVTPCDFWLGHNEGTRINHFLRLTATRNYFDNQLPYMVMIKLFQWHFDVFGLIPEGLAIDVNTLK